MGANPKKCIDAGKMTSGNYLMLWDCLGGSNQKFGYDPKMNTIYLSASAEHMSESRLVGVGSKHPAASLCMDISGGKVTDGTRVDTSSCDGCWNQQWYVIGPAAAMSLDSSESDRLQSPRYEPRYNWELGYEPRQEPRFFNLSESVGDMCPPKPSPAPGPPAPPAQGILPHCENGNQYNWPKFDSQQQLQASPWAKYFQTVYGEVPSSGYPICIYGFSMIYPPIAAQAGVKLPTPHKVCPQHGKAGVYYSMMSGLTASDAHWIWNPNLSHPSTNGLPANHWVEFLHTAFAVDGSATWAYYAPGSAVWLYTGNTRVYKNHNGASMDLLHLPCSDPTQECVAEFEFWYGAMKKKNLQTIQFLKHSDMNCVGFPGTGNLAIEIVNIGGSGVHTCGGPGGKTRFRAGWEAKHDCTCNNLQKVINCKGFGIHR